MLALCTEAGVTLRRVAEADPELDLGVLTRTGSRGDRYGSVDFAPWDDPGGPLEPADQIAEGGLADEQLLGRAPEVQFGGDRHESFELAQLHGHTLPIDGRGRSIRSVIVPFSATAPGP